MAGCWCCEGDDGDDGGDGLLAASPGFEVGVGVEGGVGVGIGRWAFSDLLCYMDLS
jgi:hypothetical protein